MAKKIKDLESRVRRRLRGEALGEFPKEDRLTLRRADIPLHSRSTILAILRHPPTPEPDGESDVAVLAPVIAQLEGAIVESEHAVLLLINEEAQAAGCHIAIYGTGAEKKLSLLFYAAPVVEAEVPAWRHSA